MSNTVTTPGSTRDLGGHLLELDGLRGFAIVLVLLGHSFSHMPAEALSGADHLLLEPLHLCWLGVEIFFVLSGFLITGILLDSRDSPQFFRGFFARRALRIFPLYYGVLILFFFVRPLLRPNDAQEAWLTTQQGWYWLCVQNWLSVRIGGTIPGSNLISHFWSLGVEEQFYFLWPCLVYITSRRGMLAACVCVIAGALGLRILLHACGTPAESIYVMTPARIDSLAWGGFAAVLARGPAGLAGMRRCGQWLLILGSGAFLALGLAGMTFRFKTPWMVTGGHSAVAMAAAGFILVVLLMAPSSRIPSTLRTGSLLFLGKHSYAMYVLHNGALSILAHHLHFTERVFRHVPSTGIAYASTFLGVLLVTTLVSYLSWKCLEEPFMNLKRYFPR